MPKARRILNDNGTEVVVHEQQRGLEPQERDECLEHILHLIAEGVNPSPHYIFRMLGPIYYRWEAIGDQPPRFESKQRAFKCCQADVKRAREAISEMRSEVNPDAVNYDISVTVARIHQANQMVLSMMARATTLALNPLAEIEDVKRASEAFTNLSTEFDRFNKSLMSLAGNPISDSVIIKGDKNNPIQNQHQHLHAVLPGNAYSSWQGGAQDLGAVVASRSPLESQRSSINQIIQHPDIVSPEVDEEGDE
jgi:hypothetical protein